MPHSSLIDLRSVSKFYPLDGETFTALDNISLIIKPGEFTSIIGPSGSGKSTLMHIIGLLDQPSQGKVLINGEDVSQLSDNALSSLRNQFVGFVFQQFNLIPKLTILENILLPTTYSRIPLPYSPREKAQELIHRFGLEGKENSHPNKISGGQQQRVAIARALIASPKLILADEPTGNLDTKNGEIIINLLRELNRADNLTVIIVTHEPAIAKRTKRQIRITDGKIENKISNRV